ncbi:hypothetical protein F9L16_04495 [Agarivorans sp. B2Z047]|uniref:nuclear transport factor 2 family protein n=1 Tax=Agarivorans sp. B2Z047 TaxID=2652721 RepID=UPI00128D218C|nr:nuclear transport factor 2 family protein [Agarivorans sp. B2Z047]MPW28258.1 hypothetical protein [Agarivorans sp. B2Z047]UQN43914.1 nuclear transport factor 2 family protein [Agarivorans sp. B2Z047]
MKSKSIVTLLLTIGLVSSPLVVACNAKQQVFDTAHNMWEHARNAQLERMWENAPTDHTYFVAGLPLWSKQETLDTFTAMFEGVVSQDIEVVREEVTMLSETAALYTADMTYTQYDADNNLLVPTSPYSMTIVFVLRDGKWMNLHSHQSFP